MGKKTFLCYDGEQDRWCVDYGGCQYPLRCGEAFQLYIGQKSFPCRLELDNSWYVIVQETIFTLHTRAVYTVQI